MVNMDNVRFLSYDTIGYQIRNAGLEIQRFSRRAIITEILWGKISNSIFSNSANLVLYNV